MSTKRRPLVLDLFCKAGGCSRGYDMAGFEPVGVDVQPQKRYPYEFIQADALEVLRDHDFLEKFAFIHASPPCQCYSRNQASEQRQPSRSRWACAGASPGDGQAICHRERGGGSADPSGENVRQLVRIGFEEASVVRVEYAVEGNEVSAQVADAKISSAGRIC